MQDKYERRALLRTLNSLTTAYRLFLNTRNFVVHVVEQKIFHGISCVYPVPCSPLEPADGQHHSNLLFFQDVVWLKLEPSQGPSNISEDWILQPFWWGERFLLPRKQKQLSVRNGNLVELGVLCYCRGKGSQWLAWEVPYPQTLTIPLCRLTAFATGNLIYLNSGMA